MALRYQSVFKSKDGNTYAVCINDPEYTGSEVEQLIPAEEPFVISEDKDDDPFKPVRVQTGYIRVIDTDNDLFNRILPPNNTYLSVALFNGTWNGSSFTISGDSLWNGFVQSMVYTQPWTEHKTVLELPVISMLGAMQYISFPTSASAAAYNIYDVIALANQAFGVNGFSEIVMCTDVHVNMPKQVYIRKSVLVEVKDVMRADAGQTTIQKGITFYDVMEQYAAMFGYVWRESKGQLILAQLSTHGQAIRTLNISQQGQTGTDTQGVKGLEDVTFRSTDNDTSIVQGRRNVQVTFSAKVVTPLEFVLPKAPEEPGLETMHMQTWLFDERVLNGAFIFGTVYTKNLYLDAYAHADSDTVHYDYRLRLGSSEEPFDSPADAAVRRYSYVNPNFANQNAFDGQPIYCGAVPIRYSFYNYGEPIGTLIHGHLLNIFPSNYEGLDNFRTEYAAPLITFSADGISYREGAYLNIQLHCIPYYNEHFPTEDFTPPYPIQNGLNNNPTEAANKTHRILVKAMLMAKTADGRVFYYDNRAESHDADLGGTWVLVDDKQQIVNCLLRLDPATGNLYGNYRPEYYVKDVGGLYIYPPTSTVSLKFAVCNGIHVGATLYAVPYTNINPESHGYVRNYNSEAPVDAHTIILDGLSVKLVFREEFDVRSSNENVYFQDIMSDGFEESEEVNLELGTNNNNGYVSNAICREYGRDDWDYVPFTGGNMRPEVHTLQQMAAYYATVRRLHTGRILAGIDWMRNIWRYANRYYYGIVQERDWKQNEEIIKFIETT